MPPLRADRNQHGGGLLIYIRDGVPAREVAIKTLTSKEMEIKVVEINLHNNLHKLINLHKTKCLESWNFILLIMKIF